MPMFAIYVEPEFEEKVLPEIDKLVERDQVSRSVVVRTILYNVFGIKPENPAKVTDRTTPKYQAMYKKNKARSV